MTKRFVATNRSGKYLTPRRATDKMYESRSGWHKSIDEARIFSTAGAAKNSARQAGCKEPKILPVKLELIEPSAL